MIGHKVCFGEHERKGGRKGQVRSRQTRWMCWMFAYRVTTRSTPPRVDSDLRTPGTQRDMTCAGSRAPSTGRPIVTYLCTRQTLLIFLSFIAFVIIRSLTVSTIFLPSSLRVPFLPYRPISRLAYKRRSLVAITSRLFRRIVSVAFTLKLHKLVGAHTSTRVAQRSLKKRTII